MRMLRIALLPLAVVGALAGGPAAAYTCYTLYDRNDNVIYRDTLPPVDMSDEGAGARAAMRARGEYLMFFEQDTGPPVVFRMGDAGNVNLNVDRSVAGVAPAVAPAPAAPRAPAPAPAPARRPAAGRY